LKSGINGLQAESGYEKSLAESQTYSGLPGIGPKKGHFEGNLRLCETGIKPVVRWVSSQLYKGLINLINKKSYDALCPRTSVI